MEGAGGAPPKIKIKVRNPAAGASTDAAASQGVTAGASTGAAPPAAAVPQVGTKRSQALEDDDAEAAAVDLQDDDDDDDAAAGGALGSGGQARPAKRARRRVAVLDDEEEEEGGNGAADAAAQGVKAGDGGGIYIPDTDEEGEDEGGGGVGSKAGSRGRLRKGAELQQPSVPAASQQVPPAAGAKAEVKPEEKKMAPWAAAAGFGQQSKAQPAPKPQPKPSASIKSEQKSVSVAKAGAVSASGRPKRRGAGRRMARMFGEESDEDPDDLEALDHDDYEIDDDADLDEEDFDGEDSDASGGRVRRGKRGAGAGRGGKRGGRGGGGSGAITAASVWDADGGEGALPGSGETDFSHLQLKPDHANRPLWATPDGHIFLETFSPVYKQAQDFLIAIAEPVSRPEYVHEYQLTPHSLYAAVSVGLDTDTIISVLSRLSKVQLDDGLKQFIYLATKNYGKVKLVLKRNRFFVETSDPDVFETLRKDAVISAARVSDEEYVEAALKERAVAGITRVDQLDLTTQPPASSATATATQQPTTSQQAIPGSQQPAGFHQPTSTTVPAASQAGAAASQHRQAGAAASGIPDEDVGEGGRLSIDDVEEGAVDESKLVRSFEIKGDMVEQVKRRCLPGGGLNLPMLEEYDFRNDRNTPDLHVELKPHVKLRPYQEKSLSKMFGNGRARSGIIVLPCGAGKSLVGVAAAARMRKSCLCLCTSSVSVDQWKHQFMLWTNLQDHQISRFTSDSKEQFAGVAGVTITTFTMVAFSGKRSEESEKVMEAIRAREWGLLLLDEVHVVPAQMFRKVIGIIHSHCKLGLTATLVREDERIGDLNFLIGPKLYEANWLDLTRAGHIANVQCVEVWCPMTREFYREYLKPENSARKQLLYVMNPSKFLACAFLIAWHERERKDKVIVFSDNIWALREYATRLGKPFIYGPTSHAERTRVLHAFKNDPNVNTVFLSKVGDNSLDIPEANVLIQISSHAGSRRQEAQRLGRILRAKRGKAGPGGGANAALEYNAFFYTLVSQDTQEMYYSTKRQQFLIDQGYAFKVVTNLVDTALEAMQGQLQLARKEEQLDLLCRVLTAGLEEAGVEVMRDDDGEALEEAKKRKPGARRAAADIRALTGAAGLRYLEYRTQAGLSAELPTFPAPGAAGAGGGGRGGGRPPKPQISEAARKAARGLGLSKK